MDFMLGLPDKAYQLAIVDPPYGISEVWSKSRKDRFYKQGALYEYDNREAPSAEYFNELMRVSKNQIIWGGNYYSEYLPSVNGWVVWDKNRDADLTMMSEAELAWTSFKNR
ncbi:hypothetical protein [Chlorobium sp.]|uniref:hypothetical protein n=1 Tax=Chlorobium sp. TaxID=1095 RepID=UPI003C60C873